MTLEESLYSLLIVSVIAFIIPFITKRMGIPIIVGEIGFGILVGVVNKLVEHYTSHTIIQFEEGTGLFLLAEIGLMFLLFLAGLEIDINLIEEKGWKSLAIVSGMFGLTLGISWTIMHLLGYGLFMALILSTTSVGVVFPILREMGLTRTSVGQDIILGAIVADFGTMMLLPIARLVEVDPGAPWSTFLILGLVIALVFGFFFIFFVMGGYAMWRWPHEMAKFFKADDPSELGVRASFLVLMSFVAVAMTLMEREGIIFGAFLAGVAINFIFREGALLERKLFGFGYGFLIPLFFIKVGVDFTESVRLEGLVIVPLLVVIALFIKLIPSLQWLKAQGPRNTLAAGVLLSARLSLLIAAVDVGKQYGIQDVLDNEPGLIILALIMCIASPIGFRYLYVPPKGQEPATEVEPLHELMEPGGG